MPKITAEQTRTQAFDNAVQRVINMRGIPPKKILRIVKWNKAVTEAVKDINDSYQKMIKGYALLDEGGECVPQEGQPGTWQIDPEIKKDPEKVKEFYDAQKEFNTIEVDVKVMPLNMSEIPKADLSPAEVDALGELLKVE